MPLKKITPLIVLLIAGYLGWQQVAPQNGSLSSDPQRDIVNQETSNKALADAVKNRSTNRQIQGVGEVVKVLADDNDGSRHQRFIIQAAPGHSLLVAHNIDLAPRVAGISVGDLVEFNGVYEWNSQGGVIHWTHHDPRGKHQEGWLKHKGKIYK